MSDSLRRYPEYKASNVDWLGDIPAHWDVVPFFGEYEEMQVKNTGLIENTVLSLSYGRIVVKPPEKLHGLVPESFETYQIVDPGDIIIRPTDLQNDHTSLRIGFSQYRGIITSAYMCLRTWNDLSPEYGYQVLNVFDLTKAIYGYGSGLRQNLSFDHLKRVGVPVPPSDEQAAIVRFLDAAEKRIRRYIRAKQKLIKLLNEQKQAIIQQAVTRGLNPDVPMKDSGVEWLGEIPAHWNMAKIKWLFDTTSGGTPNTSQQSLYYGGSIPWIRTTDLNNGILDSHEIGITERALSDTACKVVSKGAVLIAMYGGGGTIGKNALLDIDATVNQAVCAILPNAEYHPRYVWRFMQFHRPYWMLGAEGTRKDPNISQERIRNSFILRPSAQEQEAIVKHIDEECAKLDETIRVTETEIELIREFRTCLISDVVTGKVDVRGLAFEMPDEFEDEGLLDVDEDDLLDEDELEEAFDAED